MKKEIYHIAVRFFNTKYCPPSEVVARLYPNYKQPTHKGKPCFGWSVSWYEAKSLRETKNYINKHLKMGHKIWRPIIHETWHENKTGLDILSYKKETMNYKKVIGMT